MNVQIKKYQDIYKSQILSVWEKSVLATHEFLLKEDFLEIRDFLENFDFNSLNVFCLIYEEKIIGFIGLHISKVEMLFLDPNHFGKKLGRILLDFAIENFKIDQVDVNEQNYKAKMFYEKFGFETFDRTEKDDMGKDYPILKMRLKT